MSTATKGHEEGQDVVIDVAKSRISDFWKLEDYWAIWLGFIILAIGYFLFASSGPRAEIQKQLAPHLAVMEAEAGKAPFNTIAWHVADNQRAGIQAKKNPAGKFLGTLLTKPKGWSGNVISSFYMSEDEAIKKAQGSQGAYVDAQNNTKTTLSIAQRAEEAAAAANYEDAALNKDAREKISIWNAAVSAESKAKSAATAKPYNLFKSLPLLCLVVALFFSIGMYFMGHSVPKFLLGFIGVFAIATLAQCLGGQAQMKYYGVGGEAWAIILGMLIANTVGTPSFMKSALEVEYFIKTGLVLLGAEVLMSKILAIGQPGIFIAWVVTPTVLISTYLFGQKILKMESSTLNIVISADMSVCGTSAAIATAAACRAKKEELTLAVGLSLTFTAIMMIVMPAFINWVGMNEVLAGAWIGGTIDSTGAVTAAGAFIGETAMHVAATIKMIQNVLIGFTAFGVAVYWVTKEGRSKGQPINPFEIWHRFPKFVLGFLLASVVFSSLANGFGSDLSGAVIDQGVIKGFSGTLRGWFFVLAFTAIGLATNFRELAKYFKGGKPIILYVCGQSLNLVLTLTMAYIMFYHVFPEVRLQLMMG